ncbi:hypothetical protein PTTG_06060 [Puccinia triticina 1-1 BBBD Race 1]|uniref:hydroxymethylbilane synthase n=1 Tax=Puccinia triticina (isolate 1-1 / race 1 (BBBD)) TaxID=630390 RepID=A0A0C4EZ05_PUCT1|nr:hypothetical protein PTTG_06060 [Puccinia triticina 1-1 BBBD Race 1]
MEDATSLNYLPARSSALRVSGGSPNFARGNLQTHFRKLDAPDSPYTGIILAVAGLKRIGLSERITSYLEPPDLYHAVGQGAIGIEIRTPPKIKLNETVEETILRERAMTVQRLVKSLEDWRTAFSCEAERALLRRLKGGCSVPVGVRSSLVDLPIFAVYKSALQRNEDLLTGGKEDYEVIEAFVNFVFTADLTRKLFLGAGYFVH